MAALEKTFIYSDDSHVPKSVLSGKPSSTAATHKDSNYVDLNDLMDLRLEDTKTVQECSGNDRTDECGAGDQSSSFETASSSEMPQVNENFMECPEELEGDHTAEGASENVETKIDEHEQCDLQYTDVYLSDKSESDDEASVILSDYCIPEVTEDESHYITTHEIQLSELDHDVDCDFGMGSSWDIDDDLQVYSFVDYASFDSDETIGREDTVSANVKSNQPEANMSEAAVSSKPESDIGDTDKHESSDEKPPNNQYGAGNTAGQIHLSIKATSRAIKEPRNFQEKENVLFHSSHSKGTGRQYGWHDPKGDKTYDGAKCLIALPGRLHFGSKIKGKDNEYSSGASSAVSDLDDADKEVRNLTARAFKSLAYPYFDAISFSTSSESSASEHGRGINRWSKLVDLKYGNMNVSKVRDHNIVAHKGPATNFQLARKRESKQITGLTLTSMRAPPVEIFALNGSLIKHKNASTKQIELVGNFKPKQSGVIRLTETLNLCCNVKAGSPGNERRAKYAQNTGGSRSTDDVTNTLPSGLGSELSERACNADETMEDTHKKAIFASSLLKNVISKKIQFEQERKMERGEICEPTQTPSPSFSRHEHETAKERVASKGSKGLQRQSSRFSEPDSDFSIVCLDELGDIMDSNSCDAKVVCQKEETRDSLASEPNLASTNEPGFDTKKGALEPSKSTLLRSQNSAFRSWRDGELEFQKEGKNDRSPESKVSPSNDNRGGRERGGDSMDRKMTKMSHLFVPSIQLLSNEREVGKSLADVNCTMRAAVDRGEIGGMNPRADNTLYVSDAARSIVTSKSPEIKIRLRSARDNKSDPFSIAKLLTPNIGYSAGNLMKAVDDSKCQALTAALKSDASDKVPHFMVRDIRDNKGKLQTPIHQVRDVRKLVKSSYHFVSLDNNDNKPNSADGEHKISKRNAYRNPASLSPIVIKCQSVNTNSNVKQSGNLMEPSKHNLAEDLPEADRSSPQGAIESNKTGTTHIHKQTGKMPLATTKQEGSTGLRIETKIETRTSTKKQDKVSDAGEKKTDSKMAALEKLQAAVKTMEQLYVFDRYEWKRKTEPRPVTDSHVLSLLASEEHEGPEEELGNAVCVSAPVASFRRDSNTSKTPPSGQFTQTEHPLNKEDREIFKTSHTPVVLQEQNGPKPLVLHGGTSNKNISTLRHSQKHSTPISIKAPQMNVSSSASLSAKGMAPKSPKVPVSLKISQTKRMIEERQRPNGIEAGFAPLQFTSSANSENYLTIPVKPHATAAKQPAELTCDKTSVCTLPAQASKSRAISPPSHPGHSSDTKSHRDHPSQKRSSIVMETQSPDTPTATIYHHSLPITMQAAQPHVICFSPTVQPSPIPTEHFQTTQRKMLLDPTTGSYYLVDTPVQPSTRRLFDPETGQYVDVPMPPQPPMTPVPMPISPLAISPGAYGHTYMFYPGYMPTTVIPARTIQSQLSMQAEVEAGGKAHFHSGLQGDGVYAESPYYVPSGKAQHTAPGAQHITGRGTKSKKPVISITSQQGPRIIAPPSFDGTTMSFVVEHR